VSVDVETQISDPFTLVWVLVTTVNKLHVMKDSFLHLLRPLLLLEFEKVLQHLLFLATLQNTPAGSVLSYAFAIVQT